MKRDFSLFGLLSGAIFCFLIFLSSTTESKDSEVAENVAYNNLPQVIRAPNLDKAFVLGGEVLPSSFDVRERLDRELLVNSYWQSNTMLSLKRSTRYFPTIERIFAEHGVPDDLKYLAVAESNLANATSPAKAKGVWQFMKPAGKEYGLEINDEVDERYHLERSTQAAARYLKYLHNRFGNWVDAAAAYNVGPTAYNRIKNSQGGNYFDLNLNSETARYVFRLVAIKEIMSNPQDFGFYLEPNQYYPPLDNFYEVTVDSSIESWNDFAAKHGISYRTLKIYNPWLRENKLTVISNTYQIRIPRG
jgi:hypothetical protein